MFGGGPDGMIDCNCRPMVMFVMENALMLTMTQVMRCIRDPNLSQRDKQLLKRELGAELVRTLQ